MADFQHDPQQAGHQASLTQSYPLDGSEEVERLLTGTASLSKRSALARAQDGGAGAGARRRSEAGLEDALRPAPACARPAPGSAPRRRGGSAAPGQAARRRGPNPFIEYEDREVKLQQERRWLEQDSVFMRIRREGMRHRGATQRHATRSASEASLYENRTMFGNYSVQMRRNRASRGGGGPAACAAGRAPQAACGSGPTGKCKPENHPTLKMLKQLQQTMEESMKGHEDCMKRSGFCARPASAQASSTPVLRAGSDGTPVRRASLASVHTSRSAAAP